jgi:hypothetical protein
MIESKNGTVKIITEIPKQLNPEVQEFFKGRGLKVVDAFQFRLRELLIRRANACLSLLQSHVKDIIFNDGFQIAWRRKDKTIGYFNVPTFEAMQRGIEMLEKDNIEEFMNDFAVVDQALKAICNDPDVNRSDAGECKFSELISTLMEIHSRPEFPGE